MKIVELLNLKQIDELVIDMSEQLEIFVLEKGSKRVRRCMIHLTVFDAYIIRNAAPGYSAGRYIRQFNNLEEIKEYYEEVRITGEPYWKQKMGG